MNRIPAGSDRRAAAELEKRVGALTWLVGVQLVLLLVLLGFQLFGGVGPERGKMNKPASEMTDMTADDRTAPVNSSPEDASPSVAMPPETEPDRPVRVEILNGCGVAGLAASFAQVLRNLGYDVRDTRNAPHHNYEQSWVIDRNVMPGVGRRLAASLGIAENFVTVEADPNLVDIDVTLILGKDYKNLNLQP